MTKEKAAAQPFLKHDMPMMHFWMDLNGTLNRQNEMVTGYFARRMEDGVETTLTFSQSKDPVSMMSALSSYWMRSGSDAFTTMAQLATIPVEISAEVNDLAKEETDLASKPLDDSFENAPV